MRCSHWSVMASWFLPRSWHVHSVLHLCRWWIPRNWIRFMKSMLTCSSCLVELEPSYVHEILAVHHAVSASGRYSWLLPTRNTRTITIKVHFMLMVGFSQLLPLRSGWEAKRDLLLKADCALSGSAHLFLYLLMIILSWCVHGLLANDAQHLVILL